MGSTLGWFGVRGTTVKRVVEELRASYVMANRDDIPQRFRLFEQVQSAKNLRWTLVILRAGADEDPSTAPAFAASTWAQALSFRFGRPAISFLVHDGHWSYSVFDNGSEILLQEQRSAAFTEVFGDRSRAAELLQVDPSLFGRYELALREGRHTPLEGDRFAPSNEWAHTDFARALGLEFPSDTVGSVVYAPNQADTALAGVEWRGLPVRLLALSPKLSS